MVMALSSVGCSAVLSCPHPCAYAMLCKALCVLCCEYRCRCGINGVKFWYLIKIQIVQRALCLWWHGTDIISRSSSSSGVYEKKNKNSKQQHPPQHPNYPAVVVISCRNSFGNHLLLPFPIPPHSPALSCVCRGWVTRRRWISLLRRGARASVVQGSVPG